MTYYNEIVLIGTITKILSSYFYGEEFVKVVLSVKRLSNVYDHIVVAIPTTILKSKVFVGRRMKITGNVCTSPNLFVFAKHIDNCGSEDENNLRLTGQVYSKEIVSRETLTGRLISEILIYNKYSPGKVAIIPSIAWGKTAFWAETLKWGDGIEVYGRLQSRDYEKKVAGKVRLEQRRTHEVSIQSIRKVYI